MAWVSLWYVQPVTIDMALYLDPRVLAIGVVVYAAIVTVDTYGIANMKLRLVSLIWLLKYSCTLRFVFFWTSESSSSRQWTVVHHYCIIHSTMHCRVVQYLLKIYFCIFWELVALPSSRFLLTFPFKINTGLSILTDLHWFFPCVLHQILLIVLCKERFWPHYKH